MSISIKLPTAWGATFKAPEDAPKKVPPPMMRCFEACGEWLENSFIAAMARKQGESLGGSPTSKKVKDLPGSPTSSAPKRKKKAGGVKMSEEDFQEDWYEILSLEEDDAATEDDIRTAYRKRCLETHPDKQPNNSDELFKKVQRAFDILSDPDSRAAYDSGRPFDDSIPGDSVPEAKFYTSFGPVFDRNKKWSTNDNLPSLGDENTPVEVVKKFYDAWYRYRSWRDFSHEVDLEEIDEGMQREEKRFYQRENQRLLDKCVREEMKRVRKLVDHAYHSDPRLLKKRAEEEAKVEAARKEREDARKKLREEEYRRRTEQSEREAREIEEKKNAAKVGKEAVKEMREALMGFLTGHDLICTIPTNMLLPDKIRTKNINWLINQGKRTATNIEELIQELAPKSAEPNSSSDGKGIEIVEAFNNYVTQTEGLVGVNRYGEAVKKVVPPPPAPKHADPVKETEWTEDDLLLLSKAIAKYPGGTVERWRRIGTMLHPPNKFTEEEILHKTKDMESGKLAHLLKKQKAPTLGAASNTDRASTLSKEAQEEAINNPRARLIRMLQKYNPEKLTNVNKILEAYKGKEDQLFVTLVKKFGPEPNPNDMPRSTATEESGEDAEGVEDWTVNQQKQLEDKLREFKEYKEKDKYVKVAAGVDGKTAKQCFDRFKYLAAISKAKK